MLLRVLSRIRVRKRNVAVVNNNQFKSKNQRTFIFSYHFIILSLYCFTNKYLGIAGQARNDIL